MTSEKTGTNTKSPRGWAIVGAFLGVLFGYVGTIEFPPLLATAVIAVGGLTGAIVMNEIEYQFIKYTGNVGIGPTQFRSQGTEEANIIVDGGDGGTSVDEFLTPQQPIEGLVTPSVNVIPIDVATDELVEFVSNHGDQFNNYACYSEFKGGDNMGIIIPHTTLIENNSSDTIRIAWYSPIESLIELYSFAYLFDDIVEADTEAISEAEVEGIKIDNSGGEINSIEELLVWVDEILSDPNHKLH